MDGNRIENCERMMLVIYIFSCKEFYQNVELERRQHHFLMATLTHTTIVQQ
jgi:hypothetical protein